MGRYCSCTCRSSSSHGVRVPSTHSTVNWPRSGELGSAAQTTWQTDLWRPRSTASTYAARLPADLTGREAFVLDPMLATGGTLETVISML
ncbi:MAG: uracil phosphoribosyltransferase, partial [Candidatus Sulfotelmatobacter sp.]